MAERLVTDPAVIAQLEGGAHGRPVTDPALLAQLEQGAPGGPVGAAQMPSGITGRGAADLTLTMGTGAVAEPVAGLAGILGGLLPGPEGQGAQWVGNVREALTYDVTPRAAATLQRGIEAIPAPIREAAGTVSELFGRGADIAAERFGPVAGAAVRTLPTAALELTGLRGAKALLRQAEQAGRMSAGTLSRTLKQAAPSSDDLLNASRALYKQLDNAGVVVKQERFGALVDDIVQAAKRSGLDPDITPAGMAAIRRLQGASDDAISLTDIDTLRKVAQGAATSLNRSDRNIGVQIIGRIDDFIENIKPDDLLSGDASNVGAMLRTARGLTRRGRSSEMLQEAFEKARNQASGFENGIRIQLRSILNDKRRSRFFTAEERGVMKRVVQGSPGQNLAKLVGKLGFSEGSATNILMGSLGVAGGAAVGGPAGAVAVPLIGQISRGLAQRMTRKSARFLDDVVRAGPDARKIIAAYMRHTPRSAQSAAELAQLLQRPDIALQKLPSLSLVDQAIPLVERLRAAAQASAGAAGAAMGSLETAPTERTE